MTQNEAAAIIAQLLKSYPTQRRDVDFQGLLSYELIRSRLEYETVRDRAAEWVRTHSFWPAISDLLEPVPPTPQPMKLLSPPNPIPAKQGLALLKAAIEGAEPNV